jgi:DNA-binding CsgD family transcriptional regulator
LTGGARTAVRRQQTLRASLDWSHALLTEPECILFRRLAVFLGGFDLDAAQDVADAGALHLHQVLNQLTLLVDKSLVVAEYAGRRTRYRLLETVRQYALEKLGESGEADAVRTRHRDHYTALVGLLDTPARTDYEGRLEQAETDIDNLRAAFGWSRENSDIDLAFALASSLQPLWLTRGRIREGLTWFDTILNVADAHHLDVAAAVRARALADKALLGTWVDAAASADQAQQALAIAREVDDPALLARALTACGYSANASCNAEVARPYFAEAMRLARAVDDRWRLSQILAWQATAAAIAGNAIAVRVAAEEGCELADAIGDRFDSLQCRGYLGWAQLWQGDLAGAVAQFRTVAAAADAAHADILKPSSLQGLGWALACQGEVNEARTAAEAALQAAAELGEYFLGFGYSVLAMAALAAGDVETAQDACERAWQQLSVFPQAAAVQRAYNAQAALAGGDLTAARRWADDTVSAAAGWHRAVALTTRARVAIAQRDPVLAQRDVHDALACAADNGAYVAVPDLLECLAGLAADAGGQREAARLFGSAEAMRNRMGLVRFKIYDSAYESWVATVRNALGRDELDRAWDDGAILSRDETIAYALRGHTGRKRPASSWASLTPTERDVVRLVSEGLTNNDIAARLLVSPRTVQTHLTHVYTKLGLHTRVQLIREAARHA